MDTEFIALDRDGRPILLVEAEAPRVDEQVVLWFLDDLAQAVDSIAFGMLVDPKVIRIYRRGETETAARLDTVEVLRHYVPEYDGEPSPHGSAQGFKLYIAGLTGSWLRDLAYRWKPGQPPAMREVDAIGLLALIEDGTTSDEVTLGVPSLR